ncbi:hypothetical protein Hanom_Chr06g00574501 [Helianthus anomalus]
MVLISGESVIYRSYIGQISDNIVDIIGTDILTNILYRYLGGGPITDISLIYQLIYRDINYIDYKAKLKSVMPTSTLNRRSTSQNQVLCYVANPNR